MPFDNLISAKRILAIAGVQLWAFASAMRPRSELLRPPLLRMKRGFTTRQRFKIIARGF